MKLPDLPEFQWTNCRALITSVVNILVQTSHKEAKSQQRKLAEQKEIEYDSDFEGFSEDSDGSDYEFEESTKGLMNSLNNVPDGENPNDSDDEAGDAIESEVNVVSSFECMQTGFNSFDEFKWF